jgi:putative ABC transport system ATP-binding protein
MMQLKLQALVPQPLKEKIERQGSEIWKKNLSFNQGEQLFVLAPSGTGKTTLIHTLYSLRHDFEGTFNWEGIHPKGKTNEALAHLRTHELSVIFQDLRLFPELSTWENLEIKRRLTHSITEKEMAEWMNQLGISDKKNAIARTLSYGEQQRVAIIRALLQPFKWLLMDEPFSHLDHNNALKAAALIAQVVGKQKAGFILADLDENTYFNYTQTGRL